MFNPCNHPFPYNQQKNQHKPPQVAGYFSIIRKFNSKHIDSLWCVMYDLLSLLCVLVFFLFLVVERKGRSSGFRLANCEPLSRVKKRRGANETSHRQDTTHLPCRGRERGEKGKQGERGHYVYSELDTHTISYWLRLSTSDQVRSYVYIHPLEREVGIRFLSAPWSDTRHVVWRMVRSLIRLSLLSTLTLGWMDLVLIPLPSHPYSVTSPSTGNIITTAQSIVQTSRISQSLGETNSIQGPSNNNYRTQPIAIRLSGSI